MTTPKDRLGSGTNWRLWQPLKIDVTSFGDTERKFIYGKNLREVLEDNDWYGFFPPLSEVPTHLLAIKEGEKK